MKKEIIKKILEFTKESENIMVILRAEAIDQTHNWKRYPSRRKDVDERINKLSKVSEELENSLTNPNLEEVEEKVMKKSIVSDEVYNKLLANQKPDNLPVDWEKQLADKKQLEIKLNVAQNDLSNEKQARQQAENKIQQAEQFGLTDWGNLTNQTKGETLANLLDRPKKDELEKVERERDRRPNTTLREYTELKNNQKPADYDDIKGNLNKWENGLGGKTFQQVQTYLNKQEGDERTKEDSKLIEKNTQLQQQIIGLQQQLDTLRNEKPKPVSSELDNEVDEKSGIMKKAISTNDSTTTNDKLDLEEYGGKLIQKINDVLADKDNEGKEWYVKLENTDLTEVEHIDFATTLRKKTSEEEMDNFVLKMMEKIGEQRQRHFNIIMLLKEGEKALKDENIEQVKKISASLEVYQKLAEEIPEAKAVFRSKIVQINRLKKSMNQVQQAQIIQGTK